MSAQKAVWIFNKLHGFGAQTFKALREEIGNFSELLDARTLEAFRTKPGWGHAFVDGFQAILNSDAFERERDDCSKQGIQILSILDEAYPGPLASLYDPPLILYVKGSFIPEDEVAIAIVGSRRPTVYGIRTAGHFAAALASGGITVVSGFARGIDGEAHRGALRAKGRTLAVLGCGLDIVYPKEHASLYQEIEAHGALVSEFPLGTLPEAFNFPKRNRIISGLSMGVLVVEASQKSGSLITANLAAEEGREVYAVPGPIDSVASMGTNQLIQKGAKLVQHPEDIIGDLTPQIRASFKSWRVPEAIPDLEIASASSGLLPRNDDDPVLQLLKTEPLFLDEIMNRLHENPSQIRSRLTQLELLGRIKRTFGGRYSFRGPALQ